MVLGVHIFNSEVTLVSASGPRALSPPKNQPSHILHLENLTRPFTVMQLKELLTEDGPMVKDGFWTNKIKSHCIIVVSVHAVYTTRNKILAAIASMYD